MKEKFIKKHLVKVVWKDGLVSIENKILLKIENQIITSLDVNNEFKYLIALNPNIKNSKREDILRLSKRSIIQEKIKKIEIEKNFNNPQIPQKILEQILQNVYSRIGLANLNDFKEYLIKNNIDFENVKNKLEVEALWNELILIKFSSKVKINEKNLREQINNNSKFLKSYLLSEISFEVSNLKNLNDKFIEISDVINNQGFDFAALKYSVSPSSSLGGKLDWINENSLNKSIKLAIDNSKIEIDVEKELNKLKNYEKNNQLNQYSKIYFNKVKKDLEISEL